jgi:hypothetical protein
MKVLESERPNIESWGIGERKEEQGLHNFVR